MSCVRWLLSFSVLYLTACATIVSSHKEEFKVFTTPAGATVRVMDKSCQTPCSVRLSRGEDHRIIIDKDGYENTEVKVDGYSLNPMILGNLITFSWPGALVDLVTRKAFSLSDTKADIELTPLKGTVMQKQAKTPPTVEEFEKSIVDKPTKKDIIWSDKSEFPMSWPQKWFYETDRYKYWTVVGGRKSNQAEAIQESLKKAEEIIGTEFPRSRYKSPVTFETTHIEVKRVEGLFEGWRIVRVKHSEVSLKKK